nr:unnamed protein product [Callosobruchus analis]
MCCLGQRNLP